MTSTLTPSAAPPDSGALSAAQLRARTLALAVIVTCQLMIVLDGTVVNVALPDIQRDLGFSAAGLSWVVNAYALTFGGLLLLGGRAGDILGRRRVFSLGVALFTAASFLGGIANSAGLLVAARAIQGIGAAIAAPSVLALISSSFAEGPDRNKALGVFTAVSAAGGSIGLILGGLLTDVASWRWILFINVPIGIAIVALAPRFITETIRHRGRFDLTGAVLSTAGVSTVVYGFIRASTEGWGETGTLAAFIVGVLLLVGFLLTEQRAEQPIVPLRMLAKVSRASAFLAMLLMPAALLGNFFLAAQFLQNVLGYSPLETGLAFLPLTALIFAAGQVVPRLLPKYGLWPFLVLGSTIAMLGLGWLSLATATSSYAGAILGPVLLTGLGAGMTFLPLSILILSGVPERDSGVAGGLLQAAQQVGAALGVAILVSVFVGASDGLTGGVAVPAGSPESLALTDGFEAGMRVATLFAFAVVVLAATILRRSAGGGGAPAAPAAVPAEV